MIPRIHLAGVWCGALYLVIFSIGLLLAGFIPPLSPGAGPAEIARFFQLHLAGIRLGNLFVITAASLYLPWAVTLSALIRRMEGEADFLSQTQLVGSLPVALFFFLPAMIWEVAAFRPITNPEILMMLDDTAWLFIATPVAAFLVQSVPLSAAMFMDRTRPALFPRWFMMFTVVADVLFLPGMVAFFYKSGPLAWDGVLAFWVPLVVFGVWEVSAMVLTVRIINRRPAPAR